MKKLMLAVCFAVATICAGAATNVVTYTNSEKSDRAKRIAEWTAKWNKMTSDERKAHREAQEKKLAEQRARTGEVRREQDKDGNIIVTFKDGSVKVYKVGK